MGIYIVFQWLWEDRIQAPPLKSKILAFIHGEGVAGQGQNQTDTACKFGYGHNMHHLKLGTTLYFCIPCNFAIHLFADILYCWVSNQLGL